MCFRFDNFINALRFNHHFDFHFRQQLDFVGGAAKQSLLPPLLAAAGNL